MWAWHGRATELLSEGFLQESRLDRFTLQFSQNQVQHERTDPAPNCTRALNVVEFRTWTDWGFLTKTFEGRRPQSFPSVNLENVAPWSQTRLDFFIRNSWITTYIPVRKLNPASRLCLRLSAFILTDK